MEQVQQLHSSALLPSGQSSSASVTEPVQPSFMSSEELKFYPRDYLGLNYYFRVFNKMYITDILSIPEYPLFPGSFSYKNHPIYKVDIIGVVVKVTERNKCFIYAVDDGTGVISCCCWKNEEVDNDSIPFDDNLPEKLRQKSEQITMIKQIQSHGYSLGDLLHVRGKIKVYLGEKEVVATYHNKIDSPMVEVARMAELPKLYRQNYDKPFKLPYKVAQEIDMIKQEQATGVKSQKRIVKELKEVFLAYFHEIQVCELSALELLQLESVQSVLQQLDVEDGCDREKGYLQVINQTFMTLEDDGHVCNRADNKNATYEILSKHSKLEDTIKRILIIESAKPKYSEKGCHYYHLLDELQKTFQYSKVKKSCLLYCLNKLETQSDIIRTTQCHYMAYNT